MLRRMKGNDSYSALTLRLINSLYVDAMVLADEARAYFDSFSRGPRDQLEPMDRVTFSCESLKVTTRLMNLIAWLLTVKGVAAGEVDPIKRQSPAMRLGNAAGSDQTTLDRLPPEARDVIIASIDLYRRARALDVKIAVQERSEQNPIQYMHGLLERAF
jgi:regulator of CtrA degradation